MFSSWMARPGSALTLVGALLLLLNMLSVYGIYIPILFFSVYQNRAFVNGELQFELAAPLILSLCFLVGLVSLLLAQLNWWGRAVGGMAVLGGLLGGAAHGLFIWPLSLAGSDGLQLYDTFITIADWLTALGLIACGIFTFAAKALPRWNIVPLLLGLWLAASHILFLLSSPRFFFTVYTSDAPPAFPKEFWGTIALNTLSLILWACLGIALWPRKKAALPQPTQPAVEVVG